VPLSFDSSASLPGSNQVRHVHCQLPTIAFSRSCDTARISLVDEVCFSAALWAEAAIGGAMTTRMAKAARSSRFKILSFQQGAGAALA
jgi:hypothetical protein